MDVSMRIDLSGVRLTKADATIYAYALRTREHYYCLLNGYGSGAEHPTEQLPLEGLRKLADAAGASIKRGYDSDGVHYTAVVDGVEFISFEVDEVEVA